MTFPRTQTPVRYSLCSNGRLIVEILIAGLDVVTLILLFAVLGTWYRLSRAPDDDEMDWQDPLMIGLLALSFSGTAVVLYRRLTKRRTAKTRSRTRPPHPGYRVAWELCMWLFITPSALSSLLLSDLIDIASPSMDDWSSDRDCPGGAAVFAGIFRPSTPCPSNVLALRNTQMAAYILGIIIG